MQMKSVCQEPFDDYDPRGWVMLGGGALMLTIGVGIMAKLVSFEI